MIQVADLQDQLGAHALNEQQIKAEYQARMAHMIEEVGRARLDCNTCTQQVLKRGVGIEQSFALVTLMAFLTHPRG